MVHTKLRRDVCSICGHRSTRVHLQPITRTAAFFGHSLMPPRVQSTRPRFAPQWWSSLRIRGINLSYWGDDRRATTSLNMMIDDDPNCLTPSKTQLQHPKSTHRSTRRSTRRSTDHAVSKFRFFKRPRCPAAKALAKRHEMGHRSSAMVPM